MIDHEGITPACTGNGVGGALPEGVGGDHPRVYGERAS